MKVRALVDIPGTDIKAGEFFECTDTQGKSFVAGGQADAKAVEADVYGQDIPPAKSIIPADAVDESQAKASGK